MKQNRKATLTALMLSKRHLSKHSSFCRGRVRCASGQDTCFVSAPAPAAGVTCPDQLPKHKMLLPLGPPITVAKEEDSTLSEWQCSTPCFLVCFFLRSFRLINLIISTSWKRMRCFFLFGFFFVFFYAILLELMWGCIKQLCDLPESPTSRSKSPAIKQNCLLLILVYQICTSIFVWEKPFLRKIKTLDYWLVVGLTDLAARHQTVVS